MSKSIKRAVESTLFKLLVGLAGILSLGFAAAAFYGVREVQDLVERVTTTTYCARGLILQPSASCTLRDIGERVTVDAAGYARVTSTNQSLIRGRDVKIDMYDDTYTIQLQDLGDGRWYVHAAGYWRPATQSGNCAVGVSVAPGEFCSVGSSRLFVYGVDQQYDDRKLEPMGYALLRFASGEYELKGSDDGGELRHGGLVARPSEQNRHWSIEAVPQARR